VPKEKRVLDDFEGQEVLGIIGKFTTPGSVLNQTLNVDDVIHHQHDIVRGVFEAKVGPIRFVPEKPGKDDDEDADDLGCRREQTYELQAVTFTDDDIASKLIREQRDRNEKWEREHKGEPTLFDAAADGEALGDPDEDPPVVDGEIVEDVVYVEDADGFAEPVAESPKPKRGRPTKAMVAEREAAKAAALALSGEVIQVSQTPAEDRDPTLDRHWQGVVDGTPDTPFMPPPPAPEPLPEGAMVVVTDPFLDDDLGYDSEPF
jgi:hypothetical protein